MSPYCAADVAVVGIAAELPSGSWSDSNLDYQSFFEFLLQHGEAYETIPIDRFNIHNLKGNGLGKVGTDTGAFLKDVHLFDPLEFGVTNKDARMMTVSTRKLVETAFLSFVDSGIDYRGKNIGCYMSGIAYDMFSISGHDDDEARGSVASGPSMIANRVSYHLDLRGPSIPVDTACSSTLMATHLAVQAILHGECEAAVVGGSQINHRFTDWLSYTQTGILSPNGKCKPFDVTADGFGRGEGVACVILKPLHAALRDGDKIYATILGTGINSCGSLAPVNAPVAAAQRQAMERAFAQARRQPQAVDFLELHATGTAIGDPTEANWVGEHFKRDDELVIGSVKGNVGHLEITAFLASLCKVCGVFETGMIPPTVNFSQPNPAIKWEEYQFRVPVEPERLSIRSSTGRALVAMTSSGIGGANGSCVVEGPPSVPPKASSFWRSGYQPAVLFVAGGLSPRSAGAIGETIFEGLSSWTVDVQLASARMYGRKARSMTWRSFAVKGEHGFTKFSEPILSPRIAPPLVFVFSGQGTQHYAMGRQLFRASTVFRDSILQLDDIYKTVTGQSLIEKTGLFDGARASDPFGEIWPIAITLPALTILQIALVDTLASLGIKPDIVVGHSAGETPLLYACGAGSRALAVELAIVRGKAMTLLESETGTMAAMSCTPERGSEIVTEVIAELGPGSLEIGCYNSPDAITLSGCETHIELAVKKAAGAGIFARRLRTRIPVHSVMMDICQKEYERLIGDVFLRYSVSPAMVETYSTLTGDLLDTALDARYYWDNTRRPVMFAGAIEAIAEKYPHATYVEIGPHPVLTSYITSMARKGVTIVCPLRRAKPSEQDASEAKDLVEFLGKLFIAGHTSIDLDALYGTALPPPSSIAPYPFARKDISFMIPTAQIARQQQHRNGPLNYAQLQVNERTHPDLAEHVIKAEPIMPAAGYLEMALEFGARKLYNVELISILSLSAQRPTPVEVHREGTRWSVLSAPSVDYMKTWPLQHTRLHAKGHLCIDAEPDDVIPGRSLDDIRLRLQAIDMKGLYDGFRTFADYGPTYRRVIACSRGVDPLSGHDEVFVKLRGADTDLPDISDYRIHPAILDASLHILVHPIVTGINDLARYYLPSRIGALIVHDGLLDRPFPPFVYSHATFRAYTPDTLVYDVLVMDEEGTPLYSVDEMEVSMHGNAVPPIEKRYEVVYSRINTPVDLSEGEFDDSTSSSGSALGYTTPDSGYMTESKSASTPVSTAVPETVPGSMVAKVLTLRYHRGKEMEIQEVIKQLDPLDETSLWFYATAGIDGDALLGFTRVLRREFLSWTIYSVVFDPSWPVERIARAMESLLSRRDNVEEEIEVEADGTVKVPRIVEASPPISRAPFHTDLPWTYDKSFLKQVSTPFVPPHHVLLRLTGVIPATEQLWSFVGRTSETSPLIIGVASGPLSNPLVVHEGAVAEIPQITSEDGVPYALAGVVAVLAVGHALFSRPAQMRQKTILVTHADTSLGSLIARIYNALGANVITLSTSYSVSELKAAYSRGPRIVVSGSQDDGEARTFRDMMSRAGRVFLWNDPDSGVAQMLKTDPWCVGDALRAALAHQDEFSRRPVTPTDLLPSPLPIDIPLDTALFDPAKSYVLFGGIGSIGLNAAYWMYKRGARELLLTSRSGRPGLLRKGDYAAVRTYDYLDTLPDLQVRFGSLGVGDVQSMKDLLADLERPVGGCLVLSAVAEDHPFLSQTAETFEAPFVAKVDAFRLIEQTLPIEELDFLINFSSTAGMSGNPGQTNYASANASLVGLTKKYKNATSIIAPGILDTFMMKRVDSLPDPRLKRLLRWGMTSAELFAYVEDAIRKLRDGPIWQYIPGYDWAVVHESMGSSTLYNHLVPSLASSPAGVTEETERVGSSSSVKNIVCKVLDIAVEDLSADAPFTSYGLDSISASALSYALRPFLAISQIQLLADLTLRDLEGRFGLEDADD